MCCGNGQPRNKGIDLMAACFFSQFQPDGERYRSLNLYLKKLFGEKVYKVTLNGGLTCPNRDGHIGTERMYFLQCDGSGDFAKRFASITEQLRGKTQSEKRPCTQIYRLFSSCLQTLTLL